MPQLISQEMAQNRADKIVLSLIFPAKFCFDVSHHICEIIPLFYCTFHTSRGPSVGCTGAGVSTNGLPWSQIII